jgi:tetratricopeptide (TPR) repeat protein
MTPAVFSQEEPMPVEGEVTIVETEIGLDQIVVQKEKEPRSEKEPLDPGAGAGQEKVLLLGARGPSVTPEKIVDLNRLLKKAIETNQQLEADKAGIDQQLKNLRGQRTIEVNRIKSLGTERDSYKGMLEQSQKSMLKLREQISDLESKLTERNRQMELMIVEPPAATYPEGEEALVEISARELNDLHQTVAALRRQILAGEQDLAHMTEEQKVRAQEELTALAGHVTRLEEQLKNKDTDYQARMAALQTAKEQAEEQARSLGNELKNLEEQLSQQKTDLVRSPENQQQGIKQQPSQDMLAQSVTVQASSPDQTKEFNALAPESNPAPRMTQEQGMVVAPATTSVPEVIFVPDDRARGDAAFQDRVRSQDVLAMLDQMSRQNEGLRADEGRVHYNMGNIFFHQGDYDRARDEFRMAVQLMPYDANAHFNLAFVSWEYLEDFKTALEHFQQYLWLNPEAEDASLVKEKMIAAQLEIMGSIDSKLEKDVRDEHMRWWKYTDKTNGRMGEQSK